jgi:hypothetical protein
VVVLVVVDAVGAERVGVLGQARVARGRGAAVAGAAAAVPAVQTVMPGCGSP